MTSEQKIDARKLLDIARQAASHSYSPYSKFPVGAAVLTSDGSIYTGCNIENRSIGLTICAERTAVVKAISDGHRDIEAIAVSCLHCKDSWPCGNCRQFISEFGKNIKIFAESESGLILELSVAELLPEDPTYLPSRKMKNA